MPAPVIPFAVRAMSEPAQHRLTTAAWILAGTAICGWMLPLEPNLLEEGIALHLAQRMVQGEHLFRDLASFTGPLPFELLAALFRVFGDEIAVARAAVAVLQGLACGALYALARAVRNDGLAHLAVAFLAASPVLLFPLFSLYFYSLVALHLAVFATWAALRGIESPRLAWTAGVLVASVALCKQNFGLALAVTLGVALMALARPGMRLRRGGNYIVGGACMAAATLGLYAWRGDLLPLWQSLVSLPLSFTTTFDSPYPNLWPPGELREDVFIDRGRYAPRLYSLRFDIFQGIGLAGVLWTQALYAAPPVATVLTLFAGWRSTLPAATWMHSALLLALIPTLFPRTDWGHLVYVLPSAVVQLCLLARPLGSTRSTAILATSLIAALAGVTATTGDWLWQQSGPARLGPRLPIRPVSGMLRAPTLGQVIAALRTRTTPGEPVFVARAEPLVYFASDTSNPTPYSGVIPGLREEQESTIIAALGRVRFAVMSDIDQPLFSYYSDELPGVQAHLERHFRVAPNAPRGWLTLLERSKDRGRTLIDLFDRRAQGRPFVRRHDGTLGTPDAPAPRLAARHNRRPLAWHLGAKGGGIEFDLTVPPAARFQADVGLWQTIGLTAAYDHPKDVYATVSVLPEGDRLREVARRRVLAGEYLQRGWQPLEADLSAWSGQKITLRLEVRSNRPLSEPRLAWFGSPRLALAPSDERSSARGRAAPPGRQDVNGRPGPANRLDHR